MRTWIPAVAALLLLPATAFCDDLTGDQVQALKRLLERHAAVEVLVGQKIISADEGRRADDYFRRQAEEVVGHPLATWQEVNGLVNDAEKTVGFGIFLNTVIVLAGIALLLAVVGLVGFYLRPLLVAIPAPVYETDAYAVTFLTLLSGYLWRPFHFWLVTIQPLWFVVPAAFAFGGCVCLSYWLHWERRRKGTRAAVYAGPGYVRFPAVLFGLCTLVWGALALLYHHLFPQAAIPHFLAFISVMALQSFMGFSVITAPGCIAMGWERDSQVARSTQSSLILLAAFVVIKLSGADAGEGVKLFETGCVFMGAFVYYLGLLVLSSKWYRWRAKDAAVRQRRYLQMQAVTVASGVAALYLGSTFGIGSLLGIGGTFFAIYLLEKYYEIPWKGIGWAWSLIGVAVALYFFVGFAREHPQYFVWGIH
jgi:hypothetical protein